MQCVATRNAAPPPPRLPTLACGLVASPRARWRCTPDSDPWSWLDPRTVAFGTAPVGRSGFKLVDVLHYAT
jgi:hypothetical protein